MTESVTYETRREFLAAVLPAIKTALSSRPAGYPFREWLLKDGRFNRNESGLIWTFGNWSFTNEYLDHLIISVLDERKP